MADDQGSLGEAQQWYDQYLGEAPGGSFAAEALGRKLVVLVRRGEPAAARQTAESYLKRFPRGAHASYAQEVLEGP
jgi:outer membrane protein assembly factor BamD (BamD/ComL family)